MKLEMNENGFWYALWSTIAVCVVIVAIAGLMYSNHKNELILQADTCEKAAMIDGSSYETGLMVCRIGKQ